MTKNANGSFTLKTIVSNPDGSMVNFYGGADGAVIGSGPMKPIRIEMSFPCDIFTHQSPVRIVEKGSSLGAMRRGG
jgi:hypothetical protein